MASIIIAADLVPTLSNESLFIKGDTSALLGSDLQNIWQAATFRIFNLEVPLCDSLAGIKKCGPNLAAKASVINGIKALKPTLAALANNHILDQGSQGLLSTIHQLEKAGIGYIGAGENLTAASRPYLLESDNKKIGIYACAEHEFTIAAEAGAGANPFEPLESLDHICRLKEKCDFVIVLYHGGKEHYRYPSPYLRKVCRKMAEKGADLVVCQHSHCIGAFEEYNRSVLVYGQGNFLFDYADIESCKTSLLLKVNINNRLNVEFIPIVKVKNVVHLASGQEAEDILEAFFMRSDEILKAGFIESKYRELARMNCLQYIQHFCALPEWLLLVDRYLLNSFIVKSRYNGESLLAMQNYIECEAHRELVLEGLRAMEDDQL